MARRFLPAIVLLAVVLHGVGIARSSLPAQDGLKFLRVARQFHTTSWVDVVRGTDQHPLYPALIAVAHPIVSLGTGTGPDSWRITAQVVSAVASILTILPLYLLARSMFGEGISTIASLLFVLLPLPSSIGHDTLSDPLALGLAIASMAWGEYAFRARCLRAALACGVTAGLGFLARPEVAIVPMAVGMVFLISMSWSRIAIAGQLKAAIALTVGFLAVMGSYTVVKGEISEKLALRRGIGLSSRHDAPASKYPVLPAGLDDSRWNFDAKEESDQPVRLSMLQAVARFASRWSEGMGFLFVPFAISGFLRASRSVGKALIATYAIVFTIILIRHAMTFGYLSSRHPLSLVVVALPFASHGIVIAAAWVRTHLSADSPSARLRRRAFALAAIVAIAVGAQLHHSPHMSRWGHGEAGRWLASHTKHTEKVLDTRGWATFVSERPSHDYWHVKQAIVDPSLAFVVVGEDERTAASRRGETLRAILAYAAEPVAEFPDREDASAPGVRIYRFHPPKDWKGITP